MPSPFRKVKPLSIEQDTGRHQSSPSVVHAPIGSSSRRSSSKRPSFGAAALGLHSQSSDSPKTGIVLSELESPQQPVPEFAPTSDVARSPPTSLRHKGTLSLSPVPTPLAPSTSYFSGVRDFTVSNLNVHNRLAPSKTLFEYLGPHIAHGAAHDSDERWNAPACHEETRVAIREDIVSWIKHGEGEKKPKRIMWLSGPAGCGKTAIAGSVAETCKKEDLLAATFFFSSFSGSAEQSSKRGLIATLAYHMSKNEALRQFKDHLHEAVDRHQDIFRKNLNEQAKCLILEPFQKVNDDPKSRAGWPKVVIIDGLDKAMAAQYRGTTGQQSAATSEDDQVEVLHVLLTLSKDPFFPFQIFIASRPECNIIRFFSTNALGTTLNLFLDSKYNPDADVERFLVSKFAQIRRRFGISNQSWPGQPALDRLVEMSSGQFIVPTTIIRWVEAGIPQLRLNEVLQLAQPNSGTKNPFATLDTLYRHILQRAHNPDGDPHLVVKWIVCITSAMYRSYSGDNPHANLWRQFLENVEGELDYRMAPINSLISIPPPTDTSSPITIYHRSFIDFLSSPTRCGDLFVDKLALKAFFMSRIVEALRAEEPNIAPLLSIHPTLRLQCFGALTILPPPTDNCILSSISDSRNLASWLRFLGCLSATLVCDATFWTDILLTRLFFDDGSSYIFSSGDYGIWLLGSIYCGIHKAMTCSSEPSPAKSTMGASSGIRCHAPCLYWRSGILERARELHWCVRQIEQVNPDLLQHMTLGQFKRKFHRMKWGTPCTVCGPTATGT